jgi:hypothetical protein
MVRVIRCREAYNPTERLIDRDSECDFRVACVPVCEYMRALSMRTCRQHHARCYVDAIKGNVPVGIEPLHVLSKADSHGALLNIGVAIHEKINGRRDAAVD